MLRTLNGIYNHTKNFIGRSSPPDARPLLEKLCRSLRSETATALSALAVHASDPQAVRELHAAIDNLTNIGPVVCQAYDKHNRVEAKSALSIIEAEIDRTTDLLRNGVITVSSDAREIALRTLNRLFVAKQNVKQEFGIITAIDIDIDSPTNSADYTKPNSPESLKQSVLPELPSGQIMNLSSAMLFQIRQSLFPPERMLVGGARRKDRSIRIEALFDVTGEASQSGVKADPDRLGQALIAMAESGTYFGLWIHSHPGSGSGATHPSSIDTTQHADWLRDYSPDLVSAIMVRDRYVRFWGTALETGKVDLAIEGKGVEVVSVEEKVYRLSY